MLHTLLEFKGTWRSYQKRILDHYENYIADRKLHIVAAPGSGKTTLGIELIRRIDRPCLILAPSITIREQWIKRICEAFLKDPSVKNEYLSQDLTKPKYITVVTYQALHAAMTHIVGELKDEELPDKTETVDYSTFNLIKTFQELELGTLCLDECHHLRSEWWKALEEFKKTFPSVFTVSLTATPPYDSTPAMWARYLALCGEIDEEITVPELVKEGTLCPHQDYVYFNYPTREEKKQINEFESASKNTVKFLMEDPEFETAIKGHTFITTFVDDDVLLEKPAYLSSILIYLQEKGLSFPPRLLSLLGNVPLEKMSPKWMEILLQEFLYDDTDSFFADEIYRKNLISRLKSDGLIEKQCVSLVLNKNIEKMMIRSIGKCDSIKSIVEHEYKNLKKDLRLLILTDYIRKEFQRHLGDDTKEITQLGVLPFFELLRRECVKKKLDFRIGVLCGSVIIIPAEAQHALLNLCDTPEKIHFEKIAHVDDYLMVSITGNQHFITERISQLFSLGFMQVLIGTKSLLGEGWDSPCINALILASCVGSYMLSNQMRGRAIRVFQANPDKTSNIWHLVCVKDQEHGDPYYDSENNQDFFTLSRRMENFLGLHYKENSIETGIERLTAIHLPFTAANIKKTNKEMLALSDQREQLKDRWHDSVCAFDEIEIAEEVSIKNNFLPNVLFFDKLRTIILLTIGGLLGFFLLILLIPNMKIIFGTYLVTFIALLFVSAHSLHKFKNPMSRLQIFGDGILNALKKTGQLDSSNSRVKTESVPPLYSSYLLGGSSHDKALFASCISEFFDSIDNQRYLLYNPKRKKKTDGYFVVPECFAKRKEDATVFTEYMKKFIGNYQLVYTRNEEGRKILLHGRVYCLANKEDRCFRKKTIKSALE